MSAKVLIVDDSKVMRRMIRAALAPCGYEVAEAENGQQGLDILPATAPNIALVDVNMPVLDGLGFLREARALPAFRSLPVLFITAEADPEAKEIGKAGASGWIVKPFSPDQLRQTVANVLAGNG
jgi:two-component system, chemotaxis family, chemotaxis protein CheY